MDDAELDIAASSAIAVGMVALFCGLFTSTAPAHGDACPSGAADVTRVAPGVFVRPGAHALMTKDNRGAIANTGFIIGERAVAVIDTGGSFCDGQRLRRAIRAKTKAPIKFVINTHVHPDHIFGNAAFLDDRPDFVGHRNLARAVAARGAHYLRVNREYMGAESLAGTKIVPPKTAVKDPLLLDLGGRTIEVMAWPAAHTDHDLTVLDKNTATLFLGDLLFVGHIPVLDGSLTGWFAVLRRLKAAKARRVVPGHGPASVQWPIALGPQLRYLKVLAKDVRAAIRDGETIDRAVAKAAGSEKGNWQLFDEFNARNVTGAFAELEWE